VRLNILFLIKGGTTMSIEEENKALIRQVYELWNQKRMDEYYELLEPGFVERSKVDTPLNEYKEFWPMFFNAFPDMTWEIDHIVAENDEVALRETVRATHQGKLVMPLVGPSIKPTGRQIHILNMVIYRIVRSK
jgi:predicted ester cyclase